MTENHQYNTPQQGSTDWGTPLNENFEQLDRDIEIRDSGSNLDSYTPKSGAKFLATDTGNAYVGDGSSWNQLPSPSGQLSDGSLIGEPGNVQAAIDQAANQGGGIVRLDSSRTYVQPASPWSVKSEVVLDFNGAILIADRQKNDAPNTDIIHVHPRGQVFNPKINLFWDGFADPWQHGYHSTQPYQANVFTFNSKWGGYFADNTGVFGGWSKAIGGNPDATVFNFELADSAAENYVTLLRFDHDIRRALDNTSGAFGTAVHLNSNSSDSSAFMNSIWGRGMWRNCGTFIKQEGNQPNNEHKFEVCFQPGDFTDYIWHIKPGTWARGTITGWMVWDSHDLDGTGWLIDSSNSECYSNSMRAMGFDPDEAQNNSGNSHYVNDPRTYSSTTI